MPAIFYVRNAWLRGNLQNFSATHAPSVSARSRMFADPETITVAEAPPALFRGNRSQLEHPSVSRSRGYITAPESKAYLVELSRIINRQIERPAAKFFDQFDRDLRGVSPFP
jgi:hypothetical protein